MLRDQSVKPIPLDVVFVRGAVAEIRHDLDAMEALHQKHMQTMSAEMQSKMQMLMEKMDKDWLLCAHFHLSFSTDKEIGGGGDSVSSPLAIA